MSSRSCSRSTGRAGAVGDGGRLHDGGERLAAADLADQAGELAGLHDLLGVLVGRHAGAGRAADDLVGELGVGDPELLLVGDGVEHELGLDGRLGAVLELGVELLVRLALALEVALEGRAAALQLLLRGALAPGQLGVDDRLRQRDLDLLEQGLEDLVAGVDALLQALHPVEPA